MPSLLSDTEIAEIKSALKDVTDTFMVTPIQYLRAIDSIDRFNEDREDEVFDNITLNGLVEYVDQAGDELIEDDSNGALNRQRVKVTFNTVDAQAVDLMTAEWEAKVQEEKDFFICKAIKYKVVKVITDGPLDEKDVLLVIYGKREEKQTN